MNARRVTTVLTAGLIALGLAGGGVALADTASAVSTSNTAIAAPTGSPAPGTDSPAPAGESKSGADNSGTAETHQKSKKIKRAKSNATRVHRAGTKAPGTKAHRMARKHRSGSAAGERTGAENSTPMAPSAG
jgi:hypothetical protein